MRPCKKCGKEGYHPEIIPLRMAGGYHTELCVPCQNLAEELLRPELQHIAELDVRCCTAIQSEQPDAAAEIAGQINAEKIRLYAISKKWVEETTSV